MQHPNPSEHEINALADSYAAGDFRELERLCASLIVRYPDSGFLWKALGVARMSLGSECITALEKAAELLPDDAEAHSNLGNALKDGGRLSDAEAAYRVALSLQPSYAVGHYNLGAVLQEQHRYPEAEDAYRRAIALDPDFAEAIYNLGVLLDEAGRQPAAEDCYQSVLQLHADHVGARLNLGIGFKARGRFVEAEACFRNLLVRVPTYVPAYEHLGELLESAARYPEAEQCYRQAVTIAPNNPNLVLRRAALCRRMCRYEEADRFYRTYVALRPEDVSGLNDLALVLKESGRTEEAESICRRALAKDEAPPELHNTLGLILLDADKPGDAEAAFRTALAKRTDYPDALSNLGVALCEQKRYGEAEACHREALEMAPDSAAVLTNLGSTLYMRERFPEAEAAYRRALKADSRFPEALHNLGSVLLTIGRLAEAEASFKEALRFRPGYFDAHMNLGVFYNTLGRSIEAERAFRNALSLKPANSRALTLLSVALRDQGRLSESESACIAALETGIDEADAYGNLSITLRELGRLKESEAAARKALAIKPDFLDVIGNLLFDYNYGLHRDEDTCLSEAKRYGVLVGARATGKFRSWVCGDEPECLRVGIVSGDLRDHSVGHFFESVVKALDPKRIELIAYPTHYEVSDLTRRIKPFFSAWKPLVGLNDEAAAKQIHGDGIHVLLDLSGHTAHNRLPLFAWKPAPVQASWLGYCATTGVAEMDYYIADSWTLQSSQEQYFTETIWRLPESYLCFSEPHEGGEVSALPALRNGFLTFGSFNNLTKMTDEVVTLWADLLRTVPGSRLLLKAKQLKDASVADRVRERFVAHGIEASRLQLEGPIAGRGGHLTTYERVDIGLDPFPYNGVTTTMEALWMGVPVLSLAGERFLARQGVGILNNAGLGDWVAADGTSLIVKAQSWSADLERLSALRADLRRRLKASPLLDAPRFARHFEESLFGMWRRNMDKRN